MSEHLISSSAQAKTQGTAQSIPLKKMPPINKKTVKNKLRKFRLQNAATLFNAFCHAVKTYLSYFSMIQAHIVLLYLAVVFESSILA